jgi:hypothetical protein
VTTSQNGYGMTSHNGRSSQYYGEQWWWIKKHYLNAQRNASKYSLKIKDFSNVKKNLCRFWKASKLWKNFSLSLNVVIFINNISCCCEIK